MHSQYKFICNFQIHEHKHEQQFLLGLARFAHDFQKIAKMVCYFRFVHNWSDCGRQPEIKRDTTTVQPTQTKCELQFDNFIEYDSEFYFWKIK